ncbi:MAG: response regulator [Nitrososphaeraceae archaeon]|nr:response regulator [Nitrososphaeraceae archaeon]
MTPLNSRIFSGTRDLYQIRNKLNPFISADDLVNTKSYKNLISTDPNSSVPSVLSHSDKVVAKNTEPSKVGDELGNAIKQVLVIDDDLDSAITIRTCLESYFKKDDQGSEFQVMEVSMYSNPVTALVEFKPYYYDLLLVDINMPTVNGYELVEKIIKLDLNIKVCFMSSGEVNYEAIREIRHPVKSLGCFIKKPATRDYLINRVAQELF